MRADARRNKEQILDAARLQIAARGPGASMEQIAQAAGVAVGTLYRHYPTKTDLVQAILAEFSETLVQEAEAAAASIATAGNGADAIMRLLAEFLDSAARSPAIQVAARTLDAAHSTSDQDRRARKALQTLIDAGLAGGVIRPGFAPDDVLLLMTTAPIALPEGARTRWLALCSAAIRRAPIGLVDTTRDGAAGTRTSAVPGA